MIRERKLLRLAGYDYATFGGYFITICVHGRKNEFGIIAGDVMQLNEYGLIVEQQWKWLFDQYDYLQIDEYCVMPNHFHGIIWITASVGTVATVPYGGIVTTVPYGGIVSTVPNGTEKSNQFRN